MVYSRGLNDLFPWYSESLHTHGRDYRPDDERNRPGYCPGRGSADNLFAVRDTHYGTQMNDPGPLEKP